MYKIKGLLLALIGFIGTVHAMEPSLEKTIVDQDVLEGIFEKAKVPLQKAEISPQLSSDKSGMYLNYKTFPNGVTIWKFLDLENGDCRFRLGKDIYAASLGTKFYVFDEDFDFRASEVYKEKSFADLSILKKLSELDESIHAKTPPYDKVSLYFDKEPPQNIEKTTFTLFISEWDLEELLEHLSGGYGKMVGDLPNRLNIFNQLLARNPNLYFAPCGHGCIGAQNLNGASLSKIPATFKLLLSPENVDSMQSIHIQLRSCLGGACLINSVNKGAMLENLLKEFEEIFPHLQSLSGIAVSLLLDNGIDINTVATLAYVIENKTKSFYIYPESAHRVIGSHINIAKTAEGFKYSIVNREGKSLNPTDALVLEAINLRADLTERIHAIFKNENKEFFETSDRTLLCSRGTKADILNTMTEGKSEDIKFKLIAQCINLENALRRYEGEDLPRVDLKNIILELKGGKLITPPFKQTPQEAFKEWRLGSASVSEKARKKLPPNQSFEKSDRKS